MAGVPVQSKCWSCSTLDDGIQHVLRDAKKEILDHEEAQLLREIQATCRELLQCQANEIPIRVPAFVLGEASAWDFDVKGAFVPK